MVGKPCLTGLGKSSASLGQTSGIDCKRPGRCYQLGSLLLRQYSPNLQRDFQEFRAVRVIEQSHSPSNVAAGKSRSRMSIFRTVAPSFSLLHIRAADVDQTISGFKRVLRPAGLFFTAVHRGRTTQWVKTTISGMERDTYIQEWLQVEIEDRVTSAGFRILQSRPFTRTGGRYPLLSILAQR
jgi:hypothetical protein